MEDKELVRRYQAPETHYEKDWSLADADPRQAPDLRIQRRPRMPGISGTV